MHLTVTSLQCQCLNLLMIDQGKPEEIQANKIPKPNKKETTIEWGNRVVILRSRNGCKNSGKFWWMMKFHYREALTPVLLMKFLLEPTTKRHEDLDKHNVHTYFVEDRNCEICERTKITRAPCRRCNGEAAPRAANFGDLITADHKVLSGNCESRNNHRYAVVMHDLVT